MSVLLRPLFSRLPKSEPEGEGMDSWWRRVVQCFIDEVMDCEINNYVVRDMTTTDTCSSDLDWMARGISQPRGAPRDWECDPNYCEIVLDSGADVSVMPAKWLDQGYGHAADSRVRMKDAQGHAMPSKHPA